MSETERVEALLTELLEDFDDYVGQTVAGQNWLKRARAALAGAPPLSTEALGQVWLPDTFVERAYRVAQDGRRDWSNDQDVVISAVEASAIRQQGARSVSTESMDPAKRERLERAGWKVGNTEAFLKSGSTEPASDAALALIVERIETWITALTKTRTDFGHPLPTPREIAQHLVYGQDVRLSGSLSQGAPEPASEPRIIHALAGELTDERLETFVEEIRPYTEGYGSGVDDRKIVRSLVMNLLWSLSGTPEVSEGVKCGETWGDHEIEEMTQQMREAEGHPTGPDGGCGRGPVAWKYLYRCAECGRWFHRECILKHFALHTPALSRGASEPAEFTDDELWYIIQQARDPVKPSMFAEVRAAIRRVYATREWFRKRSDRVAASPAVEEK